MHLKLSSKTKEFSGPFQENNNNNHYTHEQQYSNGEETEFIYVIISDIL